MPAFIAGRRWQPTNKRIVSSSSWRARPGGWSSSCSKRPGSPRPTPTRRRNANSSTSRKAGRRPAVSWRCVTKKEPEAGAAEQYQLFATCAYTYRVFVTNLAEPIAAVVWFYNQRAAAENLIKEANNDAGLAAHPSRRFDMNRNHFQLAMLAYNLNCWLLLFNREAQASVETLRHTTLATARLRFLFVAAKIWRHAGRTGVSYSDHYQEKGLFERLMRRLRAMAPPGTSFAPVVEGTLR